MKFSTGGDASLLLSSTSKQGSATLRFPLFASLSFGPLGGAQAVVTGIKEKRTKTEFAGEFCYKKGQRNCPRITGAGARTKKIAGIKSLDIYSLGLYVDEHATQSAFHRQFGNKTPQQIAKDPQLFEELKKANNIEKSLVLIITSGLVKRKNFLEALNERLVPPMHKAKEGAALEAFKDQFDEVNFRKGLEISFTFRNGKLITKADGKELETLNNTVLSNTLLDIYIGSNPVSPGAKAAFGAGLARMILS